MTRVLGLALYGPVAASTRYRLGQYVPGLAEHGIDLQIRHLLGDVYLRRTFGGQSKPLLAMVQAGWDRLRDLGGQGAFDAIMLHVELFPLMPAWFERALLRRPYVYDFDDACYLKYRVGHLAPLQGVLGRKFDPVMQGAAGTTAGNRMPQNYALQHNRCTTMLPTVVDTSRYVPERRVRAREFVVGCIGSPSTAPYLSELVAPLSTIGKEGPVRLVVIGGRAPSIANVTAEERAWSEAVEVSLINGFDIGVMPLPYEPWERGKCGYKLIQYVACGLPVVASPVGANAEIVERGGNGFLASNPEQWAEAIRTLAMDAGLRRRMGKEGRRRVEQTYCVQAQTGRLIGMLNRVLRQEGAACAD